MKVLYIAFIALFLLLNEWLSLNIEAPPAPHAVWESRPERRVVPRHEPYPGPAIYIEPAPTPTWVELHCWDHSGYRAKFLCY